MNGIIYSVVLNWPTPGGTVIAVFPTEQLAKWFAENRYPGEGKVYHISHKVISGPEYTNLFGQVSA